MNKGKTTKYLKYAVGEIFLVMIGILLALQVNNWNNQRLKKQLEKTILKQIRSDINEMLIDIKGDYESLGMGIKSHLNIKDYFEKDLVYHDSMCFDFEWLIRDEYMYPITSAYDNLKKEGLALITNDSIRIQIQEAYAYVLPRISKQHPFFPDLGEFFHDFYENNFTPNTDSTLVYNYKLYGEDFKYPRKASFEGNEFYVYRGYVPNDYSELKANSKFMFLMSKAEGFRFWKHNRYGRAIEILEDLDKMITDELKDNQ